LYGIKLKSVLGLTDVAVSCIIFNLRAFSKNRIFVSIRNNMQSPLKRDFARTNHFTYEAFVRSKLLPSVFNTWKSNHPGKTELDFLKDRVIPDLRIKINACFTANPMRSINTINN
jgi:hypothetical protein